MNVWLVINVMARQLSALAISAVAQQWNNGTHVQCWSQKFQKTVRYLSEFCQKTVSYKKQSELSQKCVRYQSENCQMQISVRYQSEQIWKCIRNASNFINESENCHRCNWKTVRYLSEFSQKTVIHNKQSENSLKCVTQHPKCIPKLVKMSQKSVR